MTRFLLTGLIVFAALLPIAPLLLVVLVAVAMVAVATAPVARLTRSSAAVEQRLALLAFERLRGPPAALARF